jgi:N-acylneuraminate cytidylyltransferase
MNAIAIIPARGGSKRIPRKNMKAFCGKPIIGYSIEATLESGIFDEVMVSTDDFEIAEIARQFGAAIPFMRSPETSDDFATTSDVLFEVLSKYKTKDRTFDLFCCVYPAAPMTISDYLREAMELLHNTGAPSVIPVVRYSSPPQRAFRVQAGGLQMLYPEYLNVRSQDIEPLYHDCGMFYCVNTSAFLQKKQMVMDNSLPYIMSEKVVQDIDTLDDWEMAELKYKMLQERLRK